MNSLFESADLEFIPCKERSGFGLIYVGSKEMIAPTIISEIYKIQPNAKYFFDLFGGGGAMTFQALKSGLRVHYNEIKTDLVLIYEYVFDCVKNPRNSWGIFDKEMYSFCGRDEFLKIRECFKNKELLSPVDLIKKNIYSFGSLGVSYAFASSKEQDRRTGHNLIFAPFFDDGVGKAIDYFCKKMDDNGLIREILSYFVENKDIMGLSWVKRRKLYSKFMVKLEGLSIAGLLSEFKGYEFNRFLKVSNMAICDLISKKRPDLVATAKKYKQKRSGETITLFNDLRAFPQTQQLQRLQQLEQLERLERLEQLENITLSNLSYADFDFKKNGLKPDEVVIYCDPPYLRSEKAGGVNGRAYHKKGFNHHDFIKWCKEQEKNGFKVFVSESEGFAELSRFKMIWRGQKASNTTKKENTALMNEYLFLCG